MGRCCRATWPAVAAPPHRVSLACQVPVRDPDQLRVDLRMPGSPLRILRTWAGEEVIEAVCPHHLLPQWDPPLLVAAHTPGASPRGPPVSEPPRAAVPRPQRAPEGP